MRAAFRGLRLAVQVVAQVPSDVAPAAWLGQVGTCLVGWGKADGGWWRLGPERSD